MVDTPSIFSSLTPTIAYLHMSIGNGHLCSIKGYGMTTPTSFLTSHDVFYVSNFPTIFYPPMLSLVPLIMFSYSTHFYYIPIAMH